MLIFPTFHFNTLSSCKISHRFTINNSENARKNRNPFPLQKGSIFVRSDPFCFNQNFWIKRNCRMRASTPLKNTQFLTRLNHVIYGSSIDFCGWHQIEMMKVPLSVLNFDHVCACDHSIIRSILNDSSLVNSFVIFTLSIFYPIRFAHSFTHLPPLVANLTFILLTLKSWIKSLRFSQRKSQTIKSVIVRYTKIKTRNFLARFQKEQTCESMNMRFI